MSHSRSDSGAGRYANLGGAPSEAPRASLSTPTDLLASTGATAVAQDCIGFRRTWPCGHHQDLLACGHGCPIADHAALLNHVHFMFDIEDDGLPCPVCPPAEQQPGRTPLDNLQERVDAMARDPYFRQLQGEVAARTPALEHVDPWRVEEPPEGEEMWRVIVALSLRLRQMRREPREPGSEPPLPTIPRPVGVYQPSGPMLRYPQHQAQGYQAPAYQPTPSHQALANAWRDSSWRQAMPTAPQAVAYALPTMGPTVAQEHPMPPSGRSRRGSGQLNPATAFRAEFIPGQLGWVHNRLSRRQAARNRAAWAVAHSNQPPFRIVQGPTQAPIGSQQPLAPASAAGHTSAQPTGMQEVVTAADLEEALGPAEAAGGLAGETSDGGQASG